MSSPKLRRSQELHGCSAGQGGAHGDQKGGAHEDQKGGANASNIPDGGKLLHKSTPSMKAHADAAWAAYGAHMKARFGTLCTRCSMKAAMECLESSDDGGEPFFPQKCRDCRRLEQKQNGNDGKEAEEIPQLAE